PFPRGREPGREPTMNVKAGKHAATVVLVAVATAALAASSPTPTAAARKKETKMSASTAQPAAQPSAAAAIRPFRVHVTDEALADLRSRIAATRWPDRETVKDRSQGAPLDPFQKLVSYWGTGYDWRKAEARLNALPQFTTNVDGVDIYFIHVRSKQPGAMPLLLTHGWPGSIFEFLKTIGPLTDPTAYGGRAEDAFDVVIPSIPGYGFSGKPTGTGWGPEHIAAAWAELMKRLGYSRY